MGQRWSLTPLRIAAIYAFFSALYILFSDRIILAFISDSEQITLLQGLKGLAFITISAWIIYTLVTRYAADLRQANQALNDSQQRYRTTIDALQDGIIVLDRDNYCRICNVVLRRWHGYETGPDELVGRRITEIFPDPQSIDPTDIDEVFASGTPLVRSLPVNIAQREFPAQISIIPVLEGQTVTHAVIVIRDLTEHERLEDLKKETFKAIEQFTVQFAVLNDQIRNPLQIILGLVELDGGPNSREIARQVDEIDSIVKQLDQGWIESAKIKTFLQKHYQK
jgi:PAS domain S-box-containing protein